LVAATATTGVSLTAATVTTVLSTTASFSAQRYASTSLFVLCPSIIVIVVVVVTGATTTAFVCVATVVDDDDVADCKLFVVGTAFVVMVLDDFDCGRRVAALGNAGLRAARLACDGGCYN
jgi:hypothetical protein